MLKKRITKKPVTNLKTPKEAGKMALSLISRFQKRTSDTELEISSDLLTDQNFYLLMEVFELIAGKNLKKNIWEYVEPGFMSLEHNTGAVAHPQNRRTKLRLCIQFCAAAKK